MPHLDQAKVLLLEFLVKILELDKNDIPEKDLRRFLSSIDAEARYDSITCHFTSLGILQLHSESDWNIHPFAKNLWNFLQRAVGGRPLPGADELPCKLLNERIILVDPTSPDARIWESQRDASSTMDGALDCNRLFFFDGRWFRYQGKDQFTERSIDEQKATVFALEITKLAARAWIVDQRSQLLDSDRWQLKMPLELNDTTTDSDAKQRDIDTRPEDWKRPSQRLIDAAKRDVPAAIGEKFDRADVREHDGRRAIVAKALVKALIKLGHREDASPWAVHELIRDNLLTAAPLRLPSRLEYSPDVKRFISRPSDGYRRVKGRGKFDAFLIVATDAFWAWARTLDKPPKSEQYTLGRLISDLKSEELIQNAMLADKNTDALVSAQPSFKRDESTMAAIRRIELLCRKHGGGTRLTPSSTEKLRAKVAEMKDYSLTEVDGISLDEAADILDGKQRARSDLQPREIPESIKELVDGEFKQRAIDAWRPASLLVRVMKEWELWFNELATKGDADRGVAVELREKGTTCLSALCGLQVDIKAIRDKTPGQLAAQIPTWPWNALATPWQQEQDYLRYLRRTKGLIRRQEWRQLKVELSGFLQRLETSPTVTMQPTSSPPATTVASEPKQGERDAGKATRELPPTVAMMTAPSPPETTVPSEPKQHEGEAGNTSRQLSPSREKAYRQFDWAIEQNPQLHTDREAYDWLSNRSDFSDDLPTFGTWARYLRAARSYYDNRKNVPKATKGLSGKSVVERNQI